jgi:hypothetical protein
MTTPRLGAPELVSGQATPETTVNEQIRYIESGAGHFIFKDRDLATPPGSPADGDCYLVAASPTGAWAGQAGKIAFRVNTAWAFITPIEGFTAWVNDENVFIGYDGAAWNTLSAPSGSYQPLDSDLTAIAGLTPSQGDVIYHNGTQWTRLAAGTSGQFLKTNGAAANPAWATPSTSGATTANALTMDNSGSGAASGSTFDGSAAKTISYNTIGAKASNPSIQSVSSAATVTPTFSDDMVKITAQAAGLTLANPTGTAVPGWGMAIRIKDNGTARSIAYGTQYRAIGVTLPTTTVVSKTLYLGLIYNADDTKWDVVAVAQEA